MATPATRWAAFAGAWATEPTPERDQQSASALDRCIDKARTAWPDLDVPEEAFCAALGRAVRREPARDVFATLERVAAADLYLATACALGSHDAIAAFESSYGAALDRRIGRRTPAGLAAEVRQHIRVQLLVGDGRPPRIAEYHGLGELQPWLFVVVARLLIDAQRVRAESAHASAADPSAQLLANGSDPELWYLQAHYADVMRAAFADAVAALAPKERLVLRYRVVDGLSTEQIGAMYHVHPATVRRWLAAARERLLARVHDSIARQLGTTSEVSSVVRLAKDQLDISLRQLFGTQGVA